MRLRELQDLLYRRITEPERATPGQSDEHGLPPGGVEALVVETTSLVRLSGSASTPTPTSSGCLTASVKNFRPRWQC